MTADEREQANVERLAEGNRRRWASGIGGFALLASIVIAVVMLRRCHGDEQLSLTPAYALLAMSLSTALVAGLRALDGPLRFGDRRRDVPSSTPAAAAVLLWLACFGALVAVFLVVDVVERWQSGSPRCDVGASGSFKSVETTSDAPERRVVRVVECEVRAQAGEGRFGSDGNQAGAGPAGSGAAGGGPNL